MPVTSKSESRPQTAGPVTPLPNGQELVRPEELLVLDNDPVQDDDGLWHVSDAISQRCVDEGYAPDIQPRYVVG